MVTIICLIHDLMCLQKLKETESQLSKVQSKAKKSDDVSRCELGVHISLNIYSGYQ